MCGSLNIWFPFLFREFWRCLTDHIFSGDHVLYDFWSREIKPKTTPYGGVHESPRPFFFFFLRVVIYIRFLGCRSPVIMRSLQRRSLIVGSFLSWRLLFKHHWPETSQKIYEGFSTGSEKCVWYFDRSANFTGAFIKNGRIVSLATKIFLVCFF